MQATLEALSSDLSDTPEMATSDGLVVVSTIFRAFVIGQRVSSFPPRTGFESRTGARMSHFPNVREPA